MTITGDVGCALTLATVPTLALTADIRVDITLVRPGQLVRVLGRPLELATARRLREFIARAAEAESPQLNVPGVVDDTAGFTLEISRSIEDMVFLTASVAGSSGDPAPTVANVELPMTRGALLLAADEAR